MKVFCFALLILVVISIGCSKSKYERMVETELAKEGKVDSLFLGLKFGMTMEEFFEHCWDLNKQGIITDGRGNTAAQYKLSELSHHAFMDFYPEFYEEKIYKMPVEFRYNGWAPWNKHLSSDSLLMDVKQLMIKWYGGEFLGMQKPDGSTFFVKVDGNRRILIYIYDRRIVKVVFTDLLTERKLMNENGFFD